MTSKVVLLEDYYYYTIGPKNMTKIRKLAAVMFTDIDGYTALMSKKVRAD